MTNAFAKPIVLPAAGTARVLERVPLEPTGEYSEGWLESLLYQFPEALPIAEIDDGFSEIIPVCKQMNTNVGPIDVVYITPTGRPVIVEAKLWRNPEARRKVIGQILDYAKELSLWKYETFDAQVRMARRKEDNQKNPKGLLELARERQAGVDEARFFDSVSQNLRRGDILLLIVGDGIREGVGAITQFLEGHGTLHFTFGLVEMAIYRMADGGHLVQPRVLAQSTIIRRIVVELQSPEMVATDQPAVDVGDDDVTETILVNRLKFTQFWAEFLEKMELDDKSQPLPEPAKSTNLYFGIPTTATAWVSASLVQSAERAAVYLTFPEGALSNRLYDSLNADKDAIEKALDIPVNWESDRTKHKIVSRKTFSGNLFEERRSEVQAWLADRVNRFVTVFRPRVEGLLQQ